MNKGSLYHTFLPAFVIHYFVNMCHFDWGKDEISKLLTCIAIIGRDNEHLLRYFLVTSKSSSENSLFRSVLHFTVGYLFLGLLFCFVLGLGCVCVYSGC